jgi:hypothetical protein
MLFTAAMLADVAVAVFPAVDGAEGLFVADPLMVDVLVVTFNGVVELRAAQIFAGNVAKATINSD